MMNLLSIVFLCIVFFSPFSFAADTHKDNRNAVMLPKQFARVLSGYVDAWEKKDFDALVQLFEEGGCALPAGNPPVCGREAIKTFYSPYGGGIFKAWATDYDSDKSIAYIIGGYSWQPVEDGDKLEGKFTLVLRKHKGGDWLIVSDMDNSNQPPASAEN